MYFKQTPIAAEPALKKKLIVILSIVPYNSTMYVLTLGNIYIFCGGFLKKLNISKWLRLTVLLLSFLAMLVH